MVKRHCDHCGVVIENHTDGYTDITITIGGYTTKADLCCCCLGKLIKNVENFIDEEDFRITTKCS